MLEETVNIRKKFYEMNPEYKTVTYTQSLNTLSYFHQIHNQQKEAISYKQEATNLAEKICEENPNEILIDCVQAQLQNRTTRTFFAKKYLFCMCMSFYSLKFSITIVLRKNIFL